MKKEIIFLAPDYYGFNEVVYGGFQKFSGGNVQKIVINESYRYKNLLEKIENFFSKLFLNRNLKSIKAQKKLTQKFENLAFADVIIINRHDLLTTEQLLILHEKTSNLSCILWDSLKKIPEQQKNLNIFTKVFSFDPHDCDEKGFVKIENFYFVKKMPPSAPKYKVSYLGTYDNRIITLLEFFKFFNQNHISAIATLYIPKSGLGKIKMVLPKNIKFFHRIIPFRESPQMYDECEMILDLVHENQLGMSFRPFEALGLHKKLITNNPEVLKYDFYHPDNIFYVDTSADIVIPESFLESNYQILDEKIYEKYFIKNWVTKIVTEDEA